MDLGGTNIRACSVELNGDGTFNMIQSKAVVPPALQTAKTSSELFGFIADHLHKFLDEHHPDHCDKHGQGKDEWYRLGFTFSFPVIQTSINAGKLMRWTKGFKIEVRLPQLLLLTPGRRQLDKMLYKFYNRKSTRENSLCMSLLSSTTLWALSWPVHMPPQAKMVVSSAQFSGQVQTAHTSRKSKTSQNSKTSKISNQWS